MDARSAEERRHSHGFRNRHGWERATGSKLSMAAAIILASVPTVLPFLWGGRQPMGVGVAGLLVMAALALWMPSLVFRGRAGFSPVPGLWCLAAAGAVGLGQLVPSISALCMSHDYAALWGLSTAAGTTPLLAAFPSFQWQVLCWLLIAGAWYVLASQVFAVSGSHEQGRVPRMLLALGLSCSLAAGLCALASFIQFFGGYDSILLVWQGKSSVMSGPYWNRNHFCQLQEMGLFLDLGLLVSLATARKGSAIHSIAGGRKAFFLEGMLGFFAVLSIICIICSESRTGILMSACGLVLFLFYAGVVRRRRGVSIPVLLVALAFVLAGFYGLDHMLDRLDLALSGEDISGLTRWEMWRTALSVIGLSPWLGSGFGGMRMLAPHFGLDYMPGYVTFDVHNDYIDLAVMLGVPCACLILAFLAWKLFRVAARLGDRKLLASSLHPWAVGIFIGMLAAGGHEVMDYGFKQPANLLFFLALAVQLSCLCRALPRSSNDEKRPWWEIGRAMIVPAIALMIPAAWFGWQCMTGVQTGLELARLHDIESIPEVRRAYEPESFQRAVLAHADRVLALDAGRAEALASQASAWRELANLTRTRILASEVGRMLGRDVGVNQVWRKPYKQYREAAFLLLSPEDRDAVAACFDHARQADDRLSLAMPLNALAISDMAKALDDGIIWKPGTSVLEKADGVARSLHLHEAALALYPRHTYILRRALDAYQQAWLLASSETLKAGYASRIVELARLYGDQRPDQLVSIFPVIWESHHDLGLIKSLAPDNIRGQESLGVFCAEHGFWQEARTAYARMAELNEKRLDVETPATLGNIGFIRRERRDKAQLARVILERRISVLKSSGDEAGAAELESRLAEVRQKELTPVIEDADALMARGEYVLAEQRLRKIQDDPRALVRWAEILLVEGRLEQLVRVTHTIKSREALLAGQEHERWLRLLATLNERGIAGF